jgi:putative membrane protein
VLKIQQRGSSMHEEWGMFGSGLGIYFVVFIVFWLLLLVGLVWLVSSLVRGRNDRPSQMQGRESPLEVLDRRLASGEIDVEEYTKVRERLTSKGSRSD